MSNENTVEIHRVYSADAEKETLEVWRDNSINGQKVFTATGLGKNYQEVVSSICMNENDYVFTLTSTESNGWSEGSYLYVVVNDIEYLRGTLRGTQQKELTLSLKYLLPAQSNWRYTSQVQDTESWIHNEPYWTSYNVGQFPNVASTRYYARAITIQEFMKTMPVVEIDIFTHEGFIAYANGVEVGRFNLPTSGVTYQTTCITPLTTGVWKRIRLSGKNHLLGKSSFYLAIEVHPASPTGYADDFKAIVIPALQNDVNRLVDVTVESNIESTSGTSPNNIVDGLSSTYMAAAVPFGQELVLTMTLNNHRREWFNRYSIQASASNAAADPQEWRLLASNDGIVWKQLDYQSNQYFGSRREIHTYDLFGNNNAYNQIRLQIIRRLDDDESTIRIGDIQLFVVPDSSSSEIKLEYAPKEAYYVNVDDTIELYPKFSGYTDFTVTPELPNGLNITAANGMIYGSISEKVVNTTTFNITAKFANTDIYESTLLTLSIRECDLTTMSLFEIRKHNVADSADDQVTILLPSSTTQKATFYGQNAVSTTLHRYCIERGNYDIKLSKSSTDGWSTGSYIDLYLFYEANRRMYIGQASLRDSDSMIIPFSTTVVLPKTDTNKWSVHTSATNAVPTNWYQGPPDTSSADWASYDLVDGKGPEMTKNVWFIKRSVYVDNIQNDVQSYELGVYCRAGLVVYINGAEVYRVNVDAGDVTASSTITGGTASPYWHRVVGTKTWNSGLNTLALAIVNPPFIGNMTLDTNVRLYLSRSSGEISRTFDIIPDASSVETGYPLKNLFDGDYSTRVIMTRSPVNTTEQYWGFQFKDESAEMINKYCFINNDYANRYDPIAWDVYASEYGIGATTTWSLLSSVTNMKWQSRGHRACFTLPTVQKPYRFYRFLLRENSNQLPDNFFALADIELYVINMDSVQDAQLNYQPNYIDAFFGMPMTSMQPNAAGFTQCTVTPDLPAGITIDGNSGVISGTPIAAQPMTTYTVNCVNERGTARSNTVTIKVDPCAAPKKPFTIAVPSVGNNGKNMKITLAGAVSASMVDLRNYNSHYLTHCTDNNFYTLTAEVQNAAAVTSSSWGNRYASVRLADNRELFRISSLGKNTVTSPSFMPFYSVDGETQWKYNYGVQPLENWQNNNGTELWPSEIPENLPATDSITQYYITSFSVSNPNQIVGIETQVRIQAGIIVYLNGERIMSMNIPRSSITNSTYASTQYATSQLRKSSVMNKNLVQAQNTLAVEIHRGSNIPSKNTFLLKLLLLSDNQPRNIEGTASTNKPGISGHRINSAFDQNGNTYYGHEGICKDTYLQWSYSNAASHYINSYSVVAGDNCLHMAPSSWKVEGSRDGESWTVLDVQSGISWTSTAEQKTYKFYNENYFTMFRLTVTQCQKVSVMDTTNCPVSGLRVYSVDFKVAAVDFNTVCAAADGFPAALTNTYSYGSCDQLHSGYKRRYCYNGFFQQVESFCTVSAPSSFSYPQESYELVVNQEVSAIKPTIVCAECSFQVTPDLPYGLVLDNTRGIITGTPYNITANQRYAITASNVAGTSTRAIDILTTNETVHCYMDVVNGWESTLVNTTAVMNCPSTDYVGNMTRTCLPGSPAVWDVVINNCQLLIPNITITNTTYSFVKNNRITPIIPTVTGAAITSITVSPLLPAGLYLDPVTASITGIPTQKIASTVFTITVSNANGSATLQLTIEVTAFTCTADGNWTETDSGDTAYQACPQNKEGNWYRVCSTATPPVWQTPVDDCKYIKPVVSYPSSSYALQRNQPYTLTPNTQFYITNWSISGTLPSGLSFSSTNGVISGTPNQITALTTVTVTASNPDKVTQVSLSLSVNVYKCSADGVWPETESGQSVTRNCDNVALMEGNIIRQCSSSTSGAYWQEPVNTCKYKAPILTYASNVIQARKGEPIQTVTPTIGNQIDTMTINPHLPMGLQFHPNSGAISGTPTGDASNGAYTVTASNADHSTQAVLQIVVSVAACPAVDGWAQTERGEQAYAWCTGAAGIQTRVCGNPDDTEPQWKNIDNSGCISNPEKQKPGEGEAFVRFTLQLADVSQFDANAYAAVRRIFATSLAIQEPAVFLESFSANTFSFFAVGTSVQVRIATGIDNGENMKNLVIKLANGDLTSKLRSSNVASLGTATASVVESSFDIVEYSIFNSLATTLIIIVVIMGVILIGIGVFMFVVRSKSSGSSNGHARLGSDHGHKAGKRTKQAAVKGSGSSSSSSRHRYDDDDEEEYKPKKKSKKSKYDDDDDEEEYKPKKKSKKSKYEDEEDEEEYKPKKKSKKSKYDDDDYEEEYKPKKKSKKSKYDYSD